MIRWVIGGRVVVDDGLLDGFGDGGVEIEDVRSTGTGAAGTALVAGRWTELVGVHYGARVSRH